jgi:PAS domain S-box-containing protein
MVEEQFSRSHFLIIGSRMNSAKILIVEDETIVAMSLEDDLKQLGYKVCGAVNSGEAAISKARETQPDLVLMDIQLKGDMDGIEAATKIHQQFNIPIIFLTAYADPTTLQRAKVAEPFGYLLKPFEERELKSTIEMALNKHSRDTYYKTSLTDALLQSEERFRLFVESVSDYAMYMINKDGQIVSWNPGAERLTGYSANEVLGKDFSFIFPPELIEAGEPKRELELAARMGRSEAEGWRIRKNGTRFWVNGTTTAIKDLDGNLRGFAKITRDFTAQKRAEEKIHQLNESLEQRVKERTAQLEAANKQLESFSYSVSHDLRAPLRAIDGFSGIVLEDYSDQLSEEPKKLLSEIRENATRMGRLIDDLLSFSRFSRKEIKIQKVEMRPIVEQALAALRMDQKGRQIEIVIGDLPEAYVDPTLFKQVYINLLSNAIKYSKRQQEARIEIGSYADSSKGVVYFVKDNGAGFNMKYVNKLFGVFQRLHTDDEFEGTGVGLAIVRNIIERSGGDIWAESEVNKGSTFYFTIPDESAAIGATG